MFAVSCLLLRLMNSNHIDSCVILILIQINRKRYRTKRAKCGDTLLKSNIIVPILNLLTNSKRFPDQSKLESD